MVDKGLNIKNFSYVLKMLKTFCLMNHTHDSHTDVDIKLPHTHTHTRTHKYTHTRTHLNIPHMSAPILMVLTTPS